MTLYETLGVPENATDEEIKKIVSKEVNGIASRSRRNQ